MMILFLTAVIYLLTLPQSIGLGDSGLLAAAAASLGIPNPPGFPSYVLLGHLFTKLPWGSIAWRLGLISVLSSVGTIWIVARLAGTACRQAGLPAALFLAFSYSFWSQAVNVETYAITNLVIVSLCILAMQEKPKWWLIGLIGGIGLGLNPIVISIIPSLLYLSHKRFNLLKLVKSACVAGVVALATYSYLPIRAAVHPFLNWSDPSTFDRLIKHVTGGGLSVVSSTAVNGFTGSFTWYADAWVRFGYLLMVNYLGIGLAIAGLGAYAMYKKDRTKFWFWVLLVFTNVSLAGLYTSGNRDSWFVTSFIVGAVFLGEGIHTLYNHYNRYKYYNRYILVAAALLSFLVWFPVMRTRATSTFTIDYINDLYRNLPENALLLGGGETFNALTVYAHEALKLRPDVTPIDFTIYYGQEWYRENMGYKGHKGDRVDMPKFTDEMEFTRILEQFVAANSERPVFVTGYLLRQPVYGGTLTPAYVPQKYQLGIRPIGLLGKNIPWYLESNYQKAIDLIRMEYALGLETEGIQLLQDGKQNQAFDRFTRAGEVAPLYFDQNRLGEIIKSIQTKTPTAVPKER